MRCILTLFLSLGILPGFAKPAQAQSVVEVTSVHFDSSFWRLGLNMCLYCKNHLNTKVTKEKPLSFILCIRRVLRVKDLFAMDSYVKEETP
ncbi:MAG: hypothetical protein WC832_05620 [Anaerolineales bacterium]